MKNQIILNEKKYAEKCLAEKKITATPFSDLAIIARYNSSNGVQKKKNRQLLLTYLETCYPQYAANKMKWQETIEKIVKNTNKYKLHEIDGIWITKSELNTIECLHNLVLEKLAFVSLCLAKLNIEKYPENDGWVNNNAKEIFTLARVNDTAKNRYMRLGELKERGLIRPSMKMADLSYKVLFIDADSEKELYVSESDFRELGYKYLQYKGENIIECAECGILTRGNKNGTKKYCSNCVAYKPIEMKWIICTDCGQQIRVDAKNVRTIRCKECQEKYRRDYQKNIMRTRRISVSTAI